MAKHIDFGKLGEDIAVEYLQSQGFMILERNWRAHRNEVDILAVEGDELVSIEVKTRASDKWDHPAMVIDRKKQRSIVFATNAYMRKNRISAEVRFDVVWVIIEQDKRKIDHIKEAFIPCL